MNSKTIYLIIAGIAVAIVLAIVFYQPKSERTNTEKISASWDVKLKHDSRHPYGTYIFYELLKNSNFSFKESKGSPEDEIFGSINNPDRSLLVVVSANFPDYALLWTKIRKYVDAGNYVLFILEEDPYALEKFYKFAFHISSRADSSETLHFKNETKNYTFSFQKEFKGSLYPWKYFSLNDGASVITDSTSNRNFITTFESNTEHQYIVHEENNRGKPVYLEIPFGKGSVFIHRTPLAFTNLSLMHEKNVEHAEKVLSVIPYQKIIYATEAKPPKPKNLKARVSPLQFILSDQSLAWAYYLTIGGILLFALFNLKRKQKPVPVLPAKSNSTIEFADALSKIYFQKHNNQNLIKHQYRIFITFIRSRYQLTLIKDPTEFAGIISVKSGIAQAAVYSILMNFDKYTKTEVNDTQLIKIHNELDNFYKNCK
jgi:hypothetical protein